MKIAILTIHNIHNFGSVFQAFALQKFLQNLGYDAEILDYNPIYFRKKKIKTKVSNIIYCKSYLKRKKRYSMFIKNNMRLSNEKFMKYEDLKKIDKKYDIFIAGGDQLWNSFHQCGKDDTYKLTFTDGYKMSYGTSMGRNNFSKEELKKLKEQISDFKYLSLREKSTVETLKRCGLNNVMHVVDPVLLLEKEDYYNFLKPVQIKEKYAFVYLIDKSELLDKCVEVILKKMKLKIVQFVGMSKKCKCDYFLKDLGPQEVLSYIFNAEFVVSASFHATVFSVLLNKKFITLLPDKNTNERIEDFLDWIELSDRIIKNDDDLKKINNSIDFKNAQKIIIKKREESINYLKESLKYK